MSLVKSQNLGLLKCPVIPNESSYEIVSEGPISIWYYGKREKKTDYYAFQVIREMVPISFITFHHQTTIIAQSSLPIYIPCNINIIVDGKKVKLYLGKGCQITNKDKRKRSMAISNEQFEIPKLNIIVIHCANVKQQFHDVIQVVITDEMIAYCGGKNHILLNAHDTRITVLQ
ncbi:unnamed protein product [Cercopithifilaria johnstoni]|uniref:Uncharacterized protein n=1 Tax=Cercopithifilaria johnstoni TaxID=2874296 RepID=A0A8J2Q394_9BILA|nr:unnamed protein product [Cercopithifilaria johnstoni]